MARVYSYIYPSSAPAAARPGPGPGARAKGKQAVGSRFQHLPRVFAIRVELAAVSAARAMAIEHNRAGAPGRGIPPSYRPTRGEVSAVPCTMPWFILVGVRSVSIGTLQRHLPARAVLRQTAVQRCAFQLERAAIGHALSTAPLGQWQPNSRCHMSHLQALHPH